ncbi:MAG: chemotaxis protein CheW [Chloroflexota bacterium]
MELQLVIFKLENENFGIDIASVDGIIKVQPITAIPHAPNFVEGILNLRGTIVPVIDLHKRFGFPPKTLTSNTRIINVVVGHTRVGMMVDEVSEVLTVLESNIEAAPPMVTTVRSSFITGIAKLDDRLIIMLDIEQILSKEESALMENISEQDERLIAATV